MSDTKKKVARSIVNRLCRNNCYTKDSGVAVLLRDDLTSLSTGKLQRLLTLVKGINNVEA